ncbi:META domain-containing protein [Streptomyces beihaiensis]|uniref:META domain-containing protein n=1 Tax=Streptomyces beihaiensis TaxID=2984495 RepID=A0ABT3TZH5_9ACTN|nr:META domain-containing protein [Streptomyces beihaiensis]MCX3062467.1 META domain-containing protein [Streptomyces beihaiensis]
MSTQRSTRPRVGTRARALLAVALPLAALPALAACGTQQAPGSGKAGTVSASVDGVRWTVRSVTADGRTLTSSGRAYLEFSGGRVRGNDGCNDFDAAAPINGDSVHVGTAKSTDRACVDSKQRTFEKTFAHALGEKNKISVGGADHDRLTLTGPSGGDTIDLVKQRDAKLIGTKWSVTTLYSHGAAQPFAAPSAPVEEPGASRATPGLVFTKDSQGAVHVDVSLGCKSGRATVTIANGHLTIGRITSPGMHCMAITGGEEAVLHVLGQKLSYDIQGDSLTLTAPDGTGLGLTAAK